MSENLNTTVNTRTGELEVIEQDSVPVATLADKIADMQNGGNAGILSTIQGDGIQSKLAALVAINNSEPIADNLRKTIRVANVIVQPVTMEDSKTGQMMAQPRVILIDDAGKAFHAISGPLFRDVQNWFALVGQPKEWPTGFVLPVTVSREGSGDSRYFTSKIDDAELSKVLSALAKGASGK